MKKYILLLITIITVNIIQAQEIRDALRYSQENLNGTARFRAMSGAFGALGGDLSSINVNPAGSAIFANNQLGFTLNNTSIKNNSNFFDNTTSIKDSSFDLNQAGGVFVFKNQKKMNNWKKFSIAINFENTNVLNNSIYSAGTNPSNSIANYFVSYANGVPLNVLEDSNYDELGHGEQQAFLGYQGYIINPLNDNPTNTNYTSNVPAGGNYYQENTITAKGYNGKLSFNAATSFKDKLYIGVNLNSHFVDFRQSSRFYEDNEAPLTPDYTVSRVQFDNDLYTYGTGFSFQLGAIAKLSKELRLGIAFESPTWLRLNDEFTQKLIGVSANTSEELAPDVVNPNITNYYEPYKLQTPSKWTGSMAYVFGKKGLISVDYAIKDYSSIQFKPNSDPYYRTLNNKMNTLLNSASELRLGAEYKIEAWSLRGGYRLEQSPYKNKTTIGDLTGYSGGIGYNFGGTKLDLSYATFKRATQQGFFEQGLTDGAAINTKNSTITLTLLFEL
ncbi:MAG: transporter [Flavobacterium sp.]|nr:transporter [Flavobacterium sp.]